MLTYKPTILFVCTGNACRSQIAEGWARHLRSDQIQPYSAGIMASGLHPITVLVMKEINIDIRSYRSKSIDELSHIHFDYIIVLSDYAYELLPDFGTYTHIVKHIIDDPFELAKNIQNEKEVMNHFRRVRYEIRRFVEQLPSALPLPVEV